MSFYTTFKTHDEVLDFLENRDYPSCYQVNYLPKENEFALWIGNQPYESYEIIIDDVYNQLNKTREKNNKIRERNDYLESLLASYKKENEALKNRLYFEEGYNEKLVEENEMLKQTNKEQSVKIEELREKVLHYSKTILQTVEHLENIKTPEDSYEDIHIGLICWLDGVLEGKW